MGGIPFAWSLDDYRAHVGAAGPVIAAQDRITERLANVFAVVERMVKGLRRR